MRRVENNNNNLINTISSRDSSTPIFQNNSNNSSSNCTTTSEYLSTPPSTVGFMGGCVDLYYPSPPESLPEFYSNIKGPQGLTPIMCVIMNHKTTSLSNMLDLIDTLVSKGADLNMINTSNGETALHLAIRNGLYEVAEKLINYGADITIFDKQGRNVLHTAVGSNQYGIIKLLFLKFGDKIDIDTKTNDNLGESALISASRNSFNEIIKLLISFNVTINATDNNGQSALHWCAKVNNCQGAILLLENGANINLQDENEKTPLSVAIDELNTNEIIQLLVKYQAFVSSEDEKLIEFKHKLLNNNNKNINFLKQFKETNLTTIPQNKQTVISRQPNMKIEKEVFDKDNQLAANRKRKLNVTDVTNNNNKTSKATRKTPEINLQNKLKSENNLSSFPLQQSNNLVMSKSIQENLTNYNSYDYAGPLNQNSGYNSNYQFQNYQQTNSNYSSTLNYPQYEQPQYHQQQMTRQQPQDYNLYNDNSYLNYQQQQQQQQQQNYQPFYNSNTLLTANTTNTAYF
jgi:ankyrin repeat protein